MPQRPETIVVGSGVIGLTTAICLQDAGFPVQIVTRDLPPETTSATAGAVWYPYRARPRDRVLPWSQTTRQVLHRWTDDDGNGVATRPLVELFGHPVSDPWWKPAVPSFQRAESRHLKHGYVDGYVIEVPILTPSVYLRTLRRRFEEGGGTIEHLPEGIGSLPSLRAPSRLIVNCTGLGARKLCDDENVRPVRGQTIRVTNPGLTCCWVDEEGPLGLTYVLPRGDDCILGGTAEEGVWDRTPSNRTTKAILERSRALVPALKDAEVIEIKVGLRPARDTVRLQSVRLDNRCTLIHNYGHGGAGFTLAWGCAEEVVDRAERAVAAWA